ARKHYGLAGNGRVFLWLLRVENFHLFGQALDDPAVVAFAEISGDGMDHRVPDLVQGIHLGDDLFITFCHLQSGIMERLPGAITARERERGRFADLTDAQRIDETVERDRAPGLDRIEEIADGRFAEP